ncbi:protein lin-52 homolog isoform 1-T1 [Macrochelys suwanniensis]
MAAPTEGTDLEASLLSFEKLDRASPDLWPEQLPGVAEFAASFKSPITNSPPKWMAELENDDIDMLKELGSLTTANLMEKVRGLQNLAYQLGLDEYTNFNVFSRSPGESVGLIKLAFTLVSAIILDITFGWLKRGEKNHRSSIVCLYACHHHND